MPVVTANKNRPLPSQSGSAKAWWPLYDVGIGVWWIFFAGCGFLLSVVMISRISQRWRRTSGRAPSHTAYDQDEKRCMNLDAHSPAFALPPLANLQQTSQMSNASFPPPTIRRHSHPASEPQSFPTLPQSYTRSIPSTSDRYPGIIQHGEIFESNDHRRHVKTFHIA
ncbi:hypothetical protein L228DRAFT_37885 [Xylona heveae TC161]|uniref:Uncharacterized protein n=1 Tax=Xylona heveae (strain CBS 132557 / TC161) TaxID=1328760 RepID=A0A164ZX57_XYLHT|nr:hypothetical protein L228DRAFT_37885 [Xylona heveae TC161]KZF19648.1 hypothetical protein L228DRAFT_37885 [Xylona heveae TC161]